MIKAVLFDVDGVLIDSLAANVAFYRSLLERWGYSGLLDADLEKGHTLTLLEAIAVLSGEPSEEKVRTIWEDARRLEDYPFHLLRLPEGCTGVIETLARRYSLGVVTSRIREGVEHFYGFSGLGCYFTTAVTFEDCVRPKPAPDPLLTACARLPVSPCEAVYIGDAATDRASAAAAGVHFIAFGDAVADAPLTTCRLGDLAPLIEELGHD